MPVDFLLQPGIDDMALLVCCIPNAVYENLDLVNNLLVQLNSILVLADVQQVEIRSAQELQVSVKGTDGMVSHGSLNAHGAVLATSRFMKCSFDA